MSETEKLKQFNSEIETATRKALSSGTGGDDQWTEFLNSYGITPLSEETKNIILNSGIKIARGAFPAELRKVYEAILEKYKSGADVNPVLAKTINDFDTDTKIKEYYLKIKPFQGIGDIFRNASVGTQRYSSGLQKEKTKTITCKNCGSPRLEEMQYDYCLFCGGKLFEIKE